MTPVIVRFKVPVPVPHAFDAVSVMVNVPGLVGMPEMFPVLVFRDKPWGRVLAAEARRIMVCIRRKGERGSRGSRCASDYRRKVWGADTATSIISLSSKGYFGRNLRVGRVGRVRLA